MGKGVRTGRALVDFAMACLCLWAAAFHTPVGALGRQLFAWSVRGKAGGQPLLSYFRTGGQGGAVWANRVLPPVPAPLRMGAGTYGSAVGVAVPKSEALGLGLAATLASMGRTHAPHAAALAARYGVSPEELFAADTSPETARALLAKASRDLGSEEVAVLAFFVAPAPLQFAFERARATRGHDLYASVESHLPVEARDGMEQAAAALALATAYALRWPVDEGISVTSPFGFRVHPVTGERKLHAGVDLGVSAGHEVRAVADGEVRRASEDALNGKMLVVDHGRGVVTAYCHNSALRVSVGARVRQGEVIARSGESGRVTGPHLHYQLELSDVPVDPLRFRRSVISSPVESSATPSHSQPQVDVRALGAWRAGVTLERFSPNAPVGVRLISKTPGAKCLEVRRRKVQLDASGSGRVELVWTGGAGCSLECESPPSRWRLEVSRGGAPPVHALAVPCWTGKLRSD